MGVCDVQRSRTSQMCFCESSQTTASSQQDDQQVDPPPVLSSDNGDECELWRVNVDRVQLPPLTKHTRGCDSRKIINKYIYIYIRVCVL